MLKIKNTNIDDLIPYVNNAKQHSPEQISMIAASIKEFGFCNPILTDGENGIIAGHGRFEAARKLDLKEVPTVALKYLSPAQKKALVLADNRLGEVGIEWDFELVALELEELQDLDFDINLTGFDESFTDINFEPGTEEEQGRLDELEPKMVECPECGHNFNAREQE